MQVAVGRTIECYQILETIGKGANGLVYKALNLNNGVIVAMKEMLISKEQVKTIKKEIGFIKNLSHKNIVKYYDAVVKDHKIYLVIEYLEGGSLGGLCKRSVFPEALIKIYVQQILEGLNYLHRQGIAHRDIKGLNILLTKEGTIKIADFGVAVNVNDTTKTLSAGGTPYWMAPQTANGQDTISTQSDIWSLGCTVIELTTGRPPYAELSPLPALIRIVEDHHPPLPSNATPDCVDFLIQCFEKNPQKRATAQALLEHKWVRSAGEGEAALVRRGLRSSSIMTIENTLKAGSLNQIYTMVVKTQNKKLVYLNRYFLTLNDFQNSQIKLDIVVCIVNSSFEAYKYLEETGILKNIFTRQCSKMRVSPSRLVQLVAQCYQIGQQRDVFYMIQNNAVYYLAMLAQQHLLQKEAFVTHLGLVEKVVGLLRKMIHQQLVLPCHLIHVLEQERTLSSLATGYGFAAQLKNHQIAHSMLEIFTKYTQQNYDPTQSQCPLQLALPQLANINTFQSHPLTCLQNIRICHFMAHYPALSTALQQSSFANHLSEFVKNIVLTPQLNETHNTLVLNYLQCLHEFIYSQPERSRQFVKAGGAKRLKSLPKSLLEQPAIAGKLAQLTHLLK